MTFQIPLFPPHAVDRVLNYQPGASVASEDAREVHFEIDLLGSD